MDSAIFAITEYGFAASAGFLFLASVMHAIRTHLMSAYVASITMGLALLCQFGQVVVYRMHPLIWDKAVGFLPEKTRDSALELFVLIGIVSFLLGAVSLAVFACRAGNDSRAS